MDLNLYQQQALRTSPDDHDRVKNGCLGLIGESGEIVDIVKKYLFQSKADTPLPVDRLIDEMGDVMWYIAETASGMELELSDVLALDIPFENTYYSKLENLAVTLSLNATDAYISRFIPHSVEKSLRMIYATLLRLCEFLNTTIDYVAEVNIIKLQKRYPNGFDPERSMNRPEYQCKETDEQATGILFNQRNKTV